MAGKCFVRGAFTASVTPLDDGTDRVRVIFSFGEQIKMLTAIDLAPDEVVELSAMLLAQAGPVTPNA